MSKKVLINTLVSSGSQSGLSKYVYNLIKNLNEIETEMTFYVLVNKEQIERFDFDLKKIKYIKVKIPHNPRWLMRPFFFIWSQFYIRQIIKKYSIDLYHLPNPMPLISSLGIPIVVTIHDLAEFYGFRYGMLHSLLRRFIVKSCKKECSQIITVSNFIYEQIYECVELNTKKPVSVVGLSGEHMLCNEQTNISKKYVIYTGGVAKHKNIEFIINAFNKISDKYEYQLVLVGCEEYVRNEMTQLNSKIIVSGFLKESELAEFYSQSLCMVYPSLYEGFGLPILEAMSLGVPVITSNRTSMPEVAGDAALYVDPESVDSIARAMQKLIEDKALRAELIQKGYKRAKQFSWEETAKKTLEVYEKVYKEHKAK